MSTKKVPVSDKKPSVRYKVLTSKKYGRYLVAGKKINAGEVIIREKPVVIGPRIGNDNDDHLCSECLRIIPKHTTKVNSDVLCSNCQVAVFCSVTCEARKFHHTIEECKILKNKTISFNLNGILLPLRLWLIKKKDKKLWEKILNLEAHLEARRNTDVWRDREKYVIKTLKTLGIVNKSEENNFSELLQRICGILDVNSFEAPSSQGFKDSAACALYLKASLMAHDCRANTFLIIDDKFQLTIYASKPIDNGEIISFNYASSLMGMAERQKILREGKYFECDCPMCEDPYELGTNLSTIFCPYCSDGLITFASKTTKNPYVKEKNWKCNKCQTSLSGYLIAFYLYLVKLQIKSVGNSIKELEILLEKLSSTFHPNHFLMVNIKRKLSGLYKIENKCSSPSRKIMNRMIEICTDILDILEIAEPGISFFKAAILYNISAATFYLTNLDYSTRKITFQECMKQWKKGEKYLEKSVKMFLYAPATTPEGIIAKQALQEYKLLCQSKNY